MKPYPVLFACCGILAVVLTTGCSSNSEPSLADHNDTNIKKLCGAYGMFLVSHNLRGPKDEVELKEFLTTSPGAIHKLEMMGVSKDGIADIFISDRDGQPFKVRYGLEGLEDHPIVFEAEGVDGKRLVAFSTPRELDADEYEKAWAGKLKLDSGLDQ